MGVVLYRAAKEMRARVGSALVLAFGQGLVVDAVSPLECRGSMKVTTRVLQDVEAILHLELIASVVTAGEGLVVAAIRVKHRVAQQVIVSLNMGVPKEVLSNSIHKDRGYLTAAAAPATSCQTLRGSIPVPRKCFPSTTMHLSYQVYPWGGLLPHVAFDGIVMSEVTEVVAWPPLNSHSKEEVAGLVLVHLINNEVYQARGMTQ